MQPACVVMRRQLVSGSAGRGVRGQGEVRVWGLAELDLQQTLRQPHYVNALVAVDGEVRPMSDLPVRISYHRGSDSSESWARRPPRSGPGRPRPIK